MQVDRRLEVGDLTSTQAQLIAKAVEAFNENNAQREMRGLLPLQEKVMAGIVMVGTLPAFFKIPVTDLCPLIFAMGPTLRRKLALPIVIRRSCVLAE